MIFLDIGNYSINLDHVTHIYCGSSGGVTIEFDVQDGDEPSSITLRGLNAVYFKEFWEHGSFPGGQDLIICKVC